LPLLVRGSGADHAHDSIAPDDLAVAADFFTEANTFIFVSSTLRAEVILAADRSYGVQIRRDLVRPAGCLM
jgi:hypothetical protein